MARNFDVLVIGAGAAGASAAGGQLCVALALDQAMPAPLAALGLTTDMIAPARLAPGT